MSRLRHLAIIVLFTIGATAQCSAATGQEWASSLFSQPKHEFGTVARGANTEHVFTFTNTLQSDIFIASVRASCGCTTPSIVKQRVAPGEVGAIRAQFNTLSFVGQRGATITLQLTEPAFAEVQLRVDGYVRKDIVFTPGKIDWTTVDEGTSKTQKIAIAYAGRPDWQITKVNCGNPHVKTFLTEKKRESGIINYELLVELQPNCESGFINEEIVFETNDERLRAVPLTMTGTVQSALTASPEVLFVGDVKQGEVLKKTVFLRGKSNFRVVGVQSSDASVSTEIPQVSGMIHRIPVTIDTTGKSGTVTAELMLQTDLNGLSRPIKVVFEIEDDE